MKYKIGDNVILNDDVEFWFKKVGGYKVPIVDTTSCSYKIKIGENQYVYIDDNSINHEFTSKLNNKLKYKIGNRVVLGDAKTLTDINIDEEYAHEIAIIDIISGNTYWVAVEKDGEKWNIGDEEIDHEATAKLNNKSNDDSISSVMTIDMSSYITRRIDCEGGETMNANEILEKWHNKRYVELRNKAEDEKQKVTKQDEIQKLFEEHEVAIQKTIKEKYKVDIEVEHTFFAVTTSKSSKKLAEIEDKCKAEERELDEKIKEIKAVLEVAENQDKVFEILNKQGIIDKSYNIL